MPAGVIPPWPELQPLGAHEAVHLAWQLGLIDPVGDTGITAQQVGARNRAVLIRAGGRPAVHAKQAAAREAAEPPERGLLAAAAGTRAAALMPRYLGWSGPPLCTILTEAIDAVTGTQLMDAQFPADGFSGIGRGLALLHDPECLAEFPGLARQYLPTFFLADQTPDGAAPLLALPIADERLEALVSGDHELPRPGRLRELLGLWTASSLIHADLRLRHVFAALPGTGRTVVFCDWEDACVGDGSFDLGCLAASVLIEWHEGGLVLPETDVRDRLRYLIEGYTVAGARFDPCAFAGYTGVALIQALTEHQRYWPDETMRRIWALAARLVNEFDAAEIQRLIGAVP